MKRLITDTCIICQQQSSGISAAIGVCADCIRNSFNSAYSYIEAAHVESRTAFNLPTKPPNNQSGRKCNLCSNECFIGEGEFGYCGLRTVIDGRLVHLAGTPDRGLLHWYRDPLPTNCVAEWVCEGSQHTGFHNLAVFYASCTANCLFCQNWNFREISPLESQKISATELASMADERTFCVCYFGGDPSSQMPHALSTSKILTERGVRICWETNGMMHPKLLNKAVEYALESGGCIKFDLKTFDDEINKALTGVSNVRVKQNFLRAAERYDERPELPLVVASTLLVPGYVGTMQVAKIAEFIASINPKIPYSLLAFAPNFYMPDLPTTSARHAYEAEKSALAAGLVNVHIGNRHLIGWGNLYQ